MCVVGPGLRTAAINTGLLECIMSTASGPGVLGLQRLRLLLSSCSPGSKQRWLAGPHKAGLRLWQQQQLLL